NSKYTDSSTWHTDEMINTSDAPANPTRAGYTFSGWSNLPHTVVAGTNMITATWHAIDYHVTYDGNGHDGGSVPTDSTNYHIGDIMTVNVTHIPTKVGYTFSGWSDGSVVYAAGGTTSFTMSASDVTLTAIWSADVQVVTWDYAGGVDGNNQPTKVENNVWHTDEVISASDAPAAPTRAGYTFAGWSTLPYTVVAGTNTITAMWSANIQTVEWDYAGGVDSSGNSKYTDNSTWHTDEVISASDAPAIPSRVGYTFSGWSTLPY